MVVLLTYVYLTGKSSHLRFISFISIEIIRHCIVGDRPFICPLFHSHFIAYVVACRCFARACEEAALFGQQFWVYIFIFFFSYFVKIEIRTFKSRCSKSIPVDNSTHWRYYWLGYIDSDENWIVSLNERKVLFSISYRTPLSVWIRVC